ncbi:phosphoribosylamine--glycine ligase [Rubinisphaera italica]|uniref:Phosphoribosylamine--glycine ligase n=1 Tax=Rubinisphaera italica TaxID=2527969 RepID=A0A5C5XFT2_9PLAN|nr:phosphoribosylamine--glycine ligase [Rubinisphaera italica]TWT61618.1 Phosphoribosylamine--glycine ligase [Rubinisphaera italica]
MKVLVIGQGGREHALVWKLSQSPQVTKIYCAPGNAGTSQHAENVDISDADIDQLLAFAKREKIDLTVPGPEVPLVLGVVDQFRKAGLTIFGPTKAAAELEGSKTFAKQIMRGAKVPTADYITFDNLNRAVNYIHERCGGGRFASNERPMNVTNEEGELFQRTNPLWEQPIVVKADGLAAGKGVRVCHDADEALEFVRDCLAGNRFGEAGSRVIIEECLMGEEASILAIVDGKTIVTLDASQDHKAAYDDDQGPNTGGMGAYCPTPVIDAAMMDQITQTILIPLVHEMKRKGCPFGGVLYAGIMMTRQGPKVLEFNVRFGDPETQPVLMRLKSDLFEMLYAAAQGKLRDVPEPEWDPRPAVCVVMASKGYPGDYEKGFAIRGLDPKSDSETSRVFHAGTSIKDGKIVNSGGRVLGVTALGDNLDQAKLNAYERVKGIRWEGAWCRKDISDKARPKTEANVEETKVETDEV